MLMTVDVRLTTYKEGNVPLQSTACPQNWKIWTPPSFGEGTARLTSSKETSTGALMDLGSTTVILGVSTFGKAYQIKLTPR